MRQDNRIMKKKRVFIQCFCYCTKVRGMNIIHLPELLIYLQNGFNLILNLSLRRVVLVVAG
jgi:hypothetical protein